MRWKARIVCFFLSFEPAGCERLKGDGQHPREEADGIQASARAMGDWVQQGGDCNTATVKPPGDR